MEYKETGRAEWSTPRCGACGGDTSYYNGGGWTCDDCLLVFSDATLDAERLDPDSPICGKPCDNWWHGAGRIRPDRSYECGTCQLSEGHTSDCWTGCEQMSHV